MSVLQAIVLGIVQGLSEFLPISSSGHLIIVPWLFGWHFFAENPDLNKTFDVALHVGTFLGAATFFRSDIRTYLAALVGSAGRRSVRNQDERIAWFLVLSAIPGGLFGLLAEDFIERDLGRPWLIAVWLALFGIVLLVVDRRSRAARGIDDIATRDAIWMGIAQAIALSPGVSRSGVTITAGRALGLSREAAVRFSFLMALPIIGGAGVYRLASLAVDGLPSEMVMPFVWGVIASAFTGFLGVWVLLRWTRRRSFDVFVAYRFALAALIAVLILTGVRAASA